MPDYLKTTTLYLYADDTQIFSSSYDLDTLVENLNSDLNNIRNWLVRNKVQHPTKSKLMFNESSYNLNNKVSDNEFSFPN